jgi:hypothetical protein
VNSHRETHVLLEQLAEAAARDQRRNALDLFAAAPLLIIDDLGLRKLSATEPSRRGLGPAPR